MLLWLVSVFALFAVSSSQCTIPTNYDQLNLTCTDYNLWEEVMNHSKSAVSSLNNGRIVDFASSATHPFILDFPLKYPTEKNTYEFLMRFFDLNFLKVFQKFTNLTEATFMLTMHPNQTSGVQIYVVGVEISHDDYLYFCELMQHASTYEEGDLSVYLNCPSNFSWTSCEKNDKLENIPIRLVHVEFDFYQEKCIWQTFRIKTNLYPFSGFLTETPLWKEMIHVPRVTYVHFPARIIQGFARYRSTLFISYLNEGYYSILRENVLIEGKSFVYDFIKENSNHIALVEKYDVLKRWQSQSLHPKEFYYLYRVDNALRNRCPHLKHEKSPLETLLKAYERPVYYALYNTYEKTEEDFVNKMHERFPFLSKDLPTVPPKEAENLTFDTILYCAYLMGNGTFIGHLGTGYNWIVKTITTVDQLIENILWVQQKTFPIVIGSDRKPLNAFLDGPKKVFWWDIFSQNWKEMEDPIIDIQDIVRWSMEILNTYSELPSELKKKLDEELFENIARFILRSSDKKGDMKGHDITEAFSEVYGINVPEYYFFNYRVNETFDTYLE